VVLKAVEGDCSMLGFDVRSDGNLNKCVVSPCFHTLTIRIALVRSLTRPFRDARRFPSTRS
jgi:hypothetical protein